MSDLSKFHIQTSGKGSKILLLGHGFGWTQAVWQKTLPFLEEDFTCVTYNWVGASKDNSSFFSPSRYSTLYSYAEDLLEILEGLPYNSINYVGHSVSAMIGVLASIAKPEMFQRLFLVSGSPRYLNDTNYNGGFRQTDLDQIYAGMQSNFLEWIGGFATYVAGEDLGKFIRMDFQSSLQNMEPKIAQTLARLIFQSDFRAELSNCSVPSFVIQPKTDPAVPSEVGQFLANQLQKAKYFEIDTNGHFPQLEAPEQIANIIRSEVN